MGRAVLGLALATLLVAVGADGDASGSSPDVEPAPGPARYLTHRVMAWYRRTPPADRVTWVGLTACAALGLGVLLERMVRLRRARIIPRDFATRFLDRLRDGKLDWGKALDYCELNSSPAARVALGAVRRWDRPVSDQERTVALAQRIEADRLRRHVGTLRRVAALAPLIGLLGTLVSASRTLDPPGSGLVGTDWGPALALALNPLTAGVALAILALVAYDGLVVRVEELSGALERLGAEVIDAIALAASTASQPGAGTPSRTPHTPRVESPDSTTPPRIGTGIRP